MIRRDYRRSPSWRTALGGVLSALLAASCVSFGSPTDRLPLTPTPSDDIVVASFDFPESALLAELYAGVLEANRYPVTRLINLGSRETVDPALLQGHVDLVPEYLGTALAFTSLGRSKASSNPHLMTQKLAAVLRPQGVSVAKPAAAQNRNGIVVTKDTAQRAGLEAISDLQDEASGFTFGGPPECPERPLCLPGLEARYGLEFETFLPLDAGGPATLSALQAGEIDVGLLFTTDPDIVAHDLVLLEDDRELQPAENVVPILRSELLERFDPGVLTAIGKVTRRLSTSELRTLNRETEIEGRSPRTVADEWLAQQGLVE